MTARDLCDPLSFEDDQYTRQYEIPDMNPNLRYDYIKCFYLHTTAKLLKVETSKSPEKDREGEDNEKEREFGDPVEQLHFWLTPAETEDEADGTPVTGGPTLSDRIERLLGAPLVQRIPTTMDFSVRFPTRIVVILTEANWQFPLKKHPITMKHDYEEQYVDLQYHYWDSNNVLRSANLEPQEKPLNPYRCFSFSSSQPCLRRADNMRHGFSINLELVTPGYRPLEITIDPDIENKGVPPGVRPMN